MKLLEQFPEKLIEGFTEESLEKFLKRLHEKKTPRNFLEEYEKRLQKSSGEIPEEFPEELLKRNSFGTFRGIPGETLEKFLEKLRKDFSEEILVE